MSNLNKLLTLKELSAHLGLSESSVRWHIKKRRFRPYRLGRKMLFNLDEVMKDLKKFQS